MWSRIDEFKLKTQSSTKHMIKKRMTMSGNNLRTTKMGGASGLCPSRFFKSTSSRFLRESCFAMFLRLFRPISFGIVLLCGRWVRSSTLPLCFRLISPLVANRDLKGLLTCLRVGRCRVGGFCSLMAYLRR